MFARTDRILAVFEKKLATLKLKSNAADDAKPEEKQIADDLFRIIERLDKPKSEKRQSHPGSPTHDFDILIDRKLGKKNQKREMEKGSDADTTKWMRSRRISAEFELECLEEELEGLIAEEEEVLDDLKMLGQEIGDCTEDWADLREEMTALNAEWNAIREERQICEAKLDLLRKTISTLWDEEQKAPESWWKTKLAGFDLPSKVKPSPRDSRATASCPPTGFPDSLSVAQTYNTMLPSRYEETRSPLDPNFAIHPSFPNQSAYQGYPMSAPSHGLFAPKLLEPTSLGVGSNASAYKLSPPGSLPTENIDPASGRTSVGTQPWSTSGPSSTQPRNASRPVVPPYEYTYPASEQTRREQSHGLSNISGRYSPAAFASAAASGFGRPYSTELAPYYPYDVTAWQQAQGPYAYPGGSPYMGSSSMRPSNASAPTQSVPPMATPYFPPYHGYGNRYDQIPKWY